MNDTQWAYLDTYVRDLADRMLLRDWHITVSRDQCDDNSNATSDIWVQKMRSKIRFDRDDFPGLDADEQRRIIVHELCHHHTIRLCNTVDDARKPMGESAWWGLYYAHDRADEIAVEQLARIIAPFMPTCEMP